MKRFWRGAMVLGLVLTAAGGVAQAQYSRSREEERRVEALERAFSGAVDPNRFRTGNPDWDTQEMLASGLTALHAEHLRILEELEQLKRELRQLQGR